MKIAVQRIGAVVLTGAVLFSAGLTARAADATWRVDPVHSSANFTAVHLGFSHVNGIIPIKNASVVMAEGSSVPASVTAALDPSGIDTRDDTRDSDLKSPHFFDVAQFPAMTFVSTKITPGDDKHFTIDGNLTMHGVTHPITLKAEFLGRGPGLRKGEQRVAFTATSTIDRTQWGMTYGYPIVSNSIDIALDVEAALTQ